MRTIWWNSNNRTVQMIDQRLLPHRLELPEFADYRAVAAAIHNMTIRGAPAIGAAGAYAMALAALQSPAQTRDSLLIDLQAAKTVLDAARPTAVNLSWATQRLLDLAYHLVLPNMDDLRSALLAAAERLADEDVEINRRMGAFGAAVILDGANILHHCNTGSLAAVDYGTALGVVRAAVEQGKKVHVWVDETRPRLQGARLTAWELMQDGIPMTLIADNAAGHLMRTGKVDVVLFGADRVAANGDVANKVGSYSLAVLAQENGIPCYSVVPTSTVDLNLPSGDHIPIEERAADEVTHVGGVAVAPAQVPVLNLAFDVTPHRYLTGIMTEEGICYPPFTVSLRQAKEAAEARIRAAQSRSRAARSRSRAARS
ncbi:MAG: S-methyl-5-thioribose-1-phosphate isomerase [Anaerolineae bacterium]